MAEETITEDELHALDEIIGEYVENLGSNEEDEESHELADLTVSLSQKLWADLKSEKS